MLNVVLTLEEVHSGTAKVLNVTRSRMCPVCGGLGALPEDLETYVLLCFFSMCIGVHWSRISCPWPCASGSYVVPVGILALVASRGMSDGAGLPVHEIGGVVDAGEGETWVCPIN